jgi:predicted nucleic acid-binding protein
MRAAPDPAVIAWLNRQVNAALFTTSINVMELRYGVERLPEGRRKADLWDVLEFSLSRLVGPRVLAFDTAAAAMAARIAAEAERAGAPLGQPDAQIAAIASAYGYPIATRDLAPFQMAGLTVINPWSQAHKQ